MNGKRKVMIALGTRPEAIKLAPVIKAIEKSDTFIPVVVATAQHRNLLDQVLNFFEINPQYDLDLMKPNQDLYYTTSECLTRMKNVLRATSPEMIIVQGDTTTALSAALAAFYQRVPIAHVEAGLRTFQKYTPFPEEMNRKLITPLADLHFAPTLSAKNHLLIEGVAEESIAVTGNTAIDALLLGLTKTLTAPQGLEIDTHRPLVLLTLHRRENFGEPLIEILSTVKQFAENYQNVQWVYPVHPNPNVKEMAHSFLGTLSNVSLIEPVDYQEMLFLMKQAQFILTDSGGIQEEAPSLGKPVLVLRESTERPEAVEAGVSFLVGHHSEIIYKMMETLIDRNSQLYRNMSRPKNPFGDGTASQKILQRMAYYFREVRRNKLPEAA